MQGSGQIPISTQSSTQTPISDPNLNHENLVKLIADFKKESEEHKKVLLKYEASKEELENKIEDYKTTMVNVLAGIEGCSYDLIVISDGGLPDFYLIPTTRIDPKTQELFRYASTCCSPHHPDFISRECVIFKEDSLKEVQKKNAASYTIRIEKRPNMTEKYPATHEEADANFEKFNLAYKKVKEFKQFNVDNHQDVSNFKIRYIYSWQPYE